MNRLKVFSGECCKCDAGTPIAEKCQSGADLHTGDIVLLWHGEYLETEIECWYPNEYLTVIVTDQYTSYSDGSIVKNTDDKQPYAMGIKSCGFNAPEWRIQLVKKWSDVVEGEHWPAFGFSYRMVDVE
jgi:hypothetical protein